MTRERTVRSTRCELKGSIARMRMRKGAGSREVEGGRVEKGRREERCSPIEAAIGGKTLWGGDAPELGDLRLVEDGGEREGTLVSDRVRTETANEGQSRNGVGEQACQCELTKKRTLTGLRRTQARSRRSP